MSAEQHTRPAPTPEQIAADKLGQDLEIARAVGHERPFLHEMPWEIIGVGEATCSLLARYQRGTDGAAFLTPARQDGTHIYLPDQNPLAFSNPEWVAFREGVLAGEFRYGNERAPSERAAALAAAVAARERLTFAPSERRLVLAVDEFRAIGALTVVRCTPSLRAA